MSTNPVRLPGWADICGERMLMAIRTDVSPPLHRASNGCAVDFGDFTVFVFEDPSDGYRSCATTPLFTTGPLYQFSDNIEYIRAPVLVRHWEKNEFDQPCDGIEIIDRRNGKTILQLGTSNSEDYYPSFVSDWQPKNLANNEVSP